MSASTYAPVWDLCNLVFATLQDNDLLTQYEPIETQQISNLCEAVWNQISDEKESNRDILADSTTFANNVLPDLGSEGLKQLTDQLAPYSSELPNFKVFNNSEAAIEFADTARLLIDLTPEKTRRVQHLEFIKPQQSR